MFPIFFDQEMCHKQSDGVTNVQNLTILDPNDTMSKGTMECGKITKTSNWQQKKYIYITPNIKALLNSQVPNQKLFVPWMMNYKRQNAHKMNND